MSQTIEHTNGHTATPIKPAAKTVLLDPDVHAELQAISRRLGRKHSAVIRKALRLLDKATAHEQAKTDDEWATEDLA